MPLAVEPHLKKCWDRPVPLRVGGHRERRGRLCPNGFGSGLGPWLCGGGACGLCPWFRRGVACGLGSGAGAAAPWLAAGLVVRLVGWAGRGGGRLSRKRRPEIGRAHV